MNQRTRRGRGGHGVERRGRKERKMLFASFAGISIPCMRQRRTSHSFMNHAFVVKVHTDKDHDWRFRLSLHTIILWTVIMLMFLSEKRTQAKGAKEAADFQVGRKIWVPFSSDP